MRRLTGYIALAAFGALFSYGMLDGRAKNELVTDPIIVMLVMAGGAILPPLIVFLVRDRVLVWGNTWAEFWELPGRHALYRSGRAGHHGRRRLGHRVAAHRGQ